MDTAPKPLHARPDHPHETRAQHYLVTGGTGFIGTALCARLLADGQRVTVLSRQAQPSVAPGLTYVRSLNELSPQTRFDVVVNLAGEPVVGPRWSAARRAVLHASRRDLTQALVRWLQNAQDKPRLLISASAIGYYGVQDENDAAVLGEDAPPQPIFMSELCQQWEQAAAALADVPVAVMRLGVVLAHVTSGQGALPKMVAPLRLGLGGRLGSGRQIVSWVHLDDVLGAMDFVQSLPPAQASGVFNLTAPQPVSQAQFMDAARACMRPAVCVPLAVPAWVLQLALGEQAGLLVQGQRVLPQRLLQLGYTFRWPALDQALAACLGPR